MIKTCSVEQNEPRGRMVGGALLPALQEREVSHVQLVLDAVLHDVLDDGRPARHLVCVLVDALLARDCVPLIAATLLDETTQDD